MSTKSGIMLPNESAFSQMGDLVSKNQDRAMRIMERLDKFQEVLKNLVTITNRNQKDIEEMNKKLDRLLCVLGQHIADEGLHNESRNIA